jgi:hypothetical protein
MNQPVSHAAEEKVIQDFLLQRLNNIDQAYNKLLESVVIELKQQPPRYDVDYILSQVKIETEKLVTPIYFDSNAPNNGVTQLPASVLETIPRRDELLVKSTSFYQRLKESAGDLSHLPLEENIPDGDLNHMRNILKDLFSKRNVSKRLDIQHHFIIGKVHLTIKNQSNSTKQFLEHAKTDMGCSKSLAYFLIDFAVICMEYPKLKTVSIPVRSIQRYFAYIKQAVKNDAVFWK